MASYQTFNNIVLVGLCYLYIFFTIFVSSKVGKILNLSKKSSRKILHAMIGNLIFIIPFFTSNFYTVLVASSFILITFLVTPYSPLKNIPQRLKVLTYVTEKGHNLGLVFYAISYTILAVFFTSTPQIIAAGILPMAFGDSAASIIGERYGKKKGRDLGKKSYQGSIAMFFASFSSLMIGLFLFSLMTSFAVFKSQIQMTETTLFVSLIATIVERLSPKGFDNLTVPLFSALAFLSITGVPNL
jgi:dolichol kinase